jgi:hypothetical protein
MSGTGITLLGDFSMAKILRFPKPKLEEDRLEQEVQKRKNYAKRTARPSNTTSWNVNKSPA